MVDIYFTGLLSFSQLTLESEFWVGENLFYEVRYFYLQDLEQFLAHTHSPRCFTWQSCASTVENILIC